MGFCGTTFLKTAVVKIISVFLISLSLSPYGPVLVCPETMIMLTNWRQFSFVCPVIDHEFRNNIVKLAVDPRGDSRVDPQTTLTMLTKFIV